MNSNIYFSKFLVTNQVFYKSKHSFALVNLKPLVPGHVLVVPLRRSVISLSDLTADENDDFFRTVQLIHRFIKFQFKADSLNIAIQDGPEAGQTVPHLHTHIIPRYRTNNVGDKIYEMIDEWTFDTWNERREEYLNSGGREGRKEFAKPDDQRTETTEAQMASEAQKLAESLSKYLAQSDQQMR
ncbi:LANO_0G06832g1_1 [Lachancea nothofagi CBS 11611]|uniref:Bis(5'-adenosyl)-triphosphatase n=1 Tax=Lachancea nothofagi CBS 11611 TaxID=1266666 RepID=A0A1G4KHC5_9SACH|nr:LANO_0G06832g1_1 [Lachancea nothofagi CBS 11611]